VSEPALADDPWYRWVQTGRDGGDPDFRRFLAERMAGVRDAVIAPAQLAADARVADIGAGDGLIGLAVLERFPAATVTFVEPSPGLRAALQAQVRAHGWDARCRFVAAAVESLDVLPDAAFDAIFLRAVLAYVSDKRAAMGAFFRLLAPGGCLSLADPLFQERALGVTRLARGLAAGSFGSRAREMELTHRWLVRQFPDSLEALSRHPLTNYTERDLVRLATGAGFVPVSGRAELDVRPAHPLAWETFVRLAPYAGAPPLAEILARDFDAGERTEFESMLRPRIESGASNDENAIAYLVAWKPAPF
jgi:ubiquinone/menaquinone biosynthesis C-methylase UbiE